MGTQQTRITPFTEQEPFLWDRHRYYGYISGVGAGKTAVGVMRTALNAELWNRGDMGAIVAPTTGMVKNAILPLMRDFGLLDRWEYKGPQSSEPGLQTPDGGRIVILSADNKRQVERLASLNLAYFWIDESRDVPQRARQILIQRLRQGDYTNGYSTSTPRGKNHDYQFFVGEQDAERYTRGQSTIHETDDRLAITNVSTGANPHLDPDDVQAIRDEHPSGLLEQEVEGGFVEPSGGLFKPDMLEFVTPEDLPNRDFRWVAGVDVGVESDRQKAQTTDSDYWAIALLAVDKMSKTAFLADVLRERGMTLKQGVTWIQEQLRSVPRPEVYVESNQSQRWLKQELSDQGLNASAVMNTSKKEDRIVQLTLPLERGDIQLVNREMDDLLGYDPRFKELVSEMLSFPNGSHDDMVDALEIATQHIDLGGSSAVFASNPYEVDDGPA